MLAGDCCGADDAWRWYFLPAFDNARIRPELNHFERTSTPMPCKQMHPAQSRLSGACSSKMNLFSKITFRKTWIIVSFVSPRHYYLICVYVAIRLLFCFVILSRFFSILYSCPVQFGGRL